MKERKKRFLAYCPKVILVGTGFEPGTFDNYLTRPNDFGYCDHLCIPVFSIAYKGESAALGRRCLGPIVFFQKVLKETSFISYMKLRK